MLEIENYLDGWCPTFDEYHLYELWRNHQVLPYAGGWLDQSVSIHVLFNNCALFDEWVMLNSKLPSAAGVPSFNQLAGG